MSLAGFIWSFVRKQRLRFTVIFILALIWTLDTLIWPFFLRKIVDVLSLYETDRLSVKSSLNIVLVWGAAFGFLSKEDVDLEIF